MQLKQIPLEEVLKSLGILDVPGTVGLMLEREGVCLHATACPTETEYPGITVDGAGSNGNQIYLTHAELPNEDYPNTVTARLYAGYARFETDEPIALVCTKIRAADELECLEAEANYRRRKTKIVYINTDMAQSRSSYGGMDLEHDGE